jgi:hypothetical protein
MKTVAKTPSPGAKDRKNPKSADKPPNRARNG